MKIRTASDLKYAIQQAGHAPHFFDATTFDRYTQHGRPDNEPHRVPAEDRSQMRMQARRSARQLPDVRRNGMGD